MESTRDLSCTIDECYILKETRHLLVILLNQFLYSDLPLLLLVWIICVDLGKMQWVMNDDLIV